MPSTAHKSAGAKGIFMSFEKPDDILIEFQWNAVGYGVWEGASDGLPLWWLELLVASVGSPVVLIPVKAIRLFCGEAWKRNGCWKPFLGVARAPCVTIKLAGGHGPMHLVEH